MRRHIDRIPSGPLLACWASTPSSSGTTADRPLGSLSEMWWSVGWPVAGNSRNGIPNRLRLKSNIFERKSHFHRRLFYLQISYFEILTDVNSQPPSFLAISCLIVSSNIMVVKAGRNFVKRMESTNSCGRDWEDAMSAAAAPRARTRAITKRDGISLGKWPDWNKNQVFSLINLFWIFCFSEFANFGELGIIYRIPQFLDSDSSHLMSDMHVSGDHS